MRKIVLTGGIASGKSTVARYLIDKDIPIIDTDLISRQVVEPESEGLKQLVHRFSEGILLQDGSLDRKKLGDIVFNDEEKRVQLNQTIHPLVAKEVERQVTNCQQNNEVLIVLDVPLYFETESDFDNDEVWLVYVTPEIQLERLMKRNNYTQAEALSRIQSQIPINDKVKLADTIIDNTGNLEETYRQVDKALNRLK